MIDPAPVLGGSVLWFAQSYRTSQCRSEVLGLNAMGFFDIFRRTPAIREASALADFIDDNAAFLIQKGMYEYSRARAGHYAKVLLNEPEFLAAIEKSRWQGYPLGLAMVGEMVEKVVNPVTGEDRRPGVDALAELVLSVFDRYPVPA